jgi:DNA replication protein DnaC
VASKTAKHVTMRTQLARFPFVKGLDAFDFSYQPSLDKKQIQTLSTCHFIEHGENLVILGPPGVGKTHLAVGLGLRPSSAATASSSPRQPRSLPASPGR